MKRIYNEQIDLINLTPTLRKVAQSKYQKNDRSKLNRPTQITITNASASDMRRFSTLYPGTLEEEAIEKADLFQVQEFRLIALMQEDGPLNAWIEHWA